MEKEKLKQKVKDSRKKGSCRDYFCCMSKNEELKEENLSSNDAKNDLSQFKTISRKNSKLKQTLKSVQKAAKDQKSKEDNRDNHVVNESRDANYYKSLDREKKDQLVKTFLTQYLEVKKSRDKSAEPLVQPKKQEKTHDVCICLENNDPKKELEVEYYSSDESNIVVLAPPSPISPRKKLPKPNSDFPTKTKSAPTTSATRDSLADICYKWCQFKQSDSCVTAGDTSKNKLELIFDQSFYSEEMLSSHEGSSTISLQYKISYERAGTQRKDSVLLDHRKTEGRCCDEICGIKDGRMCQELHLEPSVKSGETESCTSLKWKLIISHHGDFKEP